MKPRLLITSFCMEIGGIERSLVELLRALDTGRMDVDLLLCSHTGPLLREIPAGIRLLPEDPRLASLLQPIRQVLPRHPLWAGARLLAKAQVPRRFPIPPHSSDGVAYATLQQYWRRSAPLLPAVKGEYDAVISFQWPHHLAAGRVNAGQKLAWVHTDFRMAALDVAEDLAVWERFEGIACVSQGVLEGFCEVHPALRERCFVFENLLDPAALRTRAAAFVPEDMPRPAGGFRLLTVGRYCYAKAFDQAIRTAKALAVLGLRFCWYAIGYGAEEQALHALAAELEVGDYFVFLGKRENPAPYIAACDLYLQPSRYEGKAVTVMEALSLHAPVAVTDFPTAAAQVTDGHDARILPMEPAAAAQGIAALLADPAERSRLAANAATGDYSGWSQLPKLYEKLFPAQEEA